MPIHTVGSISFEKRKVDDFTPPSHKVSEYDCYPPQQGGIANFNPPAEIQPVVIPDYLQQGESDRIREGASTGAAQQPEFSQIWTQAMAGLQINSMPVDTGNVPQNWKQIVLCKTSLISMQVDHIVWSITVVTTSRQVLGGITYPKGDVVAAFRVCEPSAYRFLLNRSFNPRCCPDQEDTGVEPPEESTWWDENGERIEFFISPEFQWQFDDRLQIRPEYFWPKYEYEDD